MQGKASRIRCLVAGIVCIAHVASAEPHIEGRVAVGARFSVTNESSYTEVVDHSPVRLAVDGLLGLRVGSVLAGLRAGVATPQRFFAHNYNVGEMEAGAETQIYPIDLGVGVEVATGSETWVGGWVGATVAFKHATSSATFVNAIDYYGAIPAASWKDRSTSLGFGAAVGYDFRKTAYGRFGVIFALDARSLGGVGFRLNNGAKTFTNERFTTWSPTFALAFAR